ncbi:MAG: hypothetical protein JWN03_3994 [Nocardia sp.]|uniref:hypothetical protein n=1 Tax=Nocardia sp. TaxID=1821 RepID=UPI00261E7C50|nr:hypothetical protein [Nocardia sp.]MCU1643719.1 hypothetical protein [Nocardia sp.]
MQDSADLAVRKKPVVVTGFHEPQPLSLAWEEGEQSVWAAIDLDNRNWRMPGDWQKSIDSELKYPTPSGMRLSYILALAPNDIALPYLRRPPAVSHVVPIQPLCRLLARFGTEAIDFVLAIAQTRRSFVPAVMMPITGSDMTRWMANWLNGKTYHDSAQAWFDRHIDWATADLIAAALATPGKDRRSAETALRTLALIDGYRDLILTVAANYGPEVATPITALLDGDQAGTRRIFSADSF